MKTAVSKIIGTVAGLAFGLAFGLPGVILLRWIFNKRKE